MSNVLSEVRPRPGASSIGARIPGSSRAGSGSYRITNCMIWRMGRRGRSTDTDMLSETVTGSETCRCVGVSLIGLDFVAVAQSLNSVLAIHDLVPSIKTAIS